MTYEITDEEWRQFQAIPDQGYSHRGWVDARIAERTIELRRVLRMHQKWEDDLEAGRCPSCLMMPETDCDHGEGYHMALSDLRQALQLEGEE